VKQKHLKESDMRLKTMRRSPLRILLPALLYFLPLFGACQTAWAQNGAPLKLTLSQAIDLALKQNRDLKLAQLSVVDSEQKKEIARSAYFPHIKNESTILHLTELEGVEIPAGTFGVHPVTGPIPGQSLVIDQGALTAYTSGTGLDQPLTQMFKIHESNRAAIADINTAKIQVDQAQNDIALKVRQLYYGILIAQLKQQAASEEVAASQVKTQESTDAVEKGRALEVVALESRASLLDARQAALTQKLEIHDLMVTLDDLLGLALNTELQLEADPPASVSIPSREECLRIARESSPEVRAAEQAVIKARAGLSAAKDAYIPDVTGLARYSYQSGIPFLVHNFGTFGVELTYDLFDGGKREAEIKDSRTLLAQAELNLTRVEESVAVQVEKAYDKVEQLQDLVGVAEEALNVRTEAARLADRQFEQNAALASIRSEAHAKVISAQASSLEANLGLSLARGELIRTIGQLPR
jgi:outer membrane protein TolC